MNVLLRTLLTCMLVVFLSQIALARGAFTMSYSDGSSDTDSTNVYWMDTLRIVDWDTRQEVRVAYPGIIIFSNVQETKMMLFLPAYNGPGVYTLTGTSDRDYSESSNAVFSTGNTGAYWVSPDSNLESRVEITKDAAGVISGTYDVAVYRNGKAIYMAQPKKPILMKGTFENVTKREGR